MMRITDWSRKLGRCGYCSEFYDLGQTIHKCSNCESKNFPIDWSECQVGFTYWPEGEQAYWKHTTESKRHAIWLEISRRSTGEHLYQLNTNWAGIKAMAKLMSDPRATRLQKLLASA